MSSIATQKVKLEYFNIAGVAERVRLALAIGGVDFEDVREYLKNVTYKSTVTFDSSNIRHCRHRVPRLVRPQGDREVRAVADHDSAGRQGDLPV